MSEEQTKYGTIEPTEAAKALVASQKTFGPALRNATNPHYKNRYADLEACIAAVMPALNNNGLALIQRVVPVDGWVHVETVFLHESGESISGGIIRLPVQRPDPQGYGSALTYARRYGLMAACGIAPEDDDGNAASREEPKPELITIDQCIEIQDLINETKSDTAKFLKYIGAESIETIPASSFQKAIAALNKKRAA